MKVIAIWERPIAHERYGGSFCLFDDGRLLEVTHEREFQGTDKDGKRIYTETGFPEWGNAFKKDDRFDVEKADYFLKHFGGKMVYQGKEV